MKIFTNELGHMTNMAGMPEYGKNLHLLKIHMKALGRIGMKICTNELSHITNMAPMPIYGKNLKKSPTPEPIDQ